MTKIKVVVMTKKPYEGLRDKITSMVSDVIDITCQYMYGTCVDNVNYFNYEIPEGIDHTRYISFIKRIYNEIDANTISVKYTSRAEFEYIYGVWTCGDGKKCIVRAGEVTTKLDNARVNDFLKLIETKQCFDNPVFIEYYDMCKRMNALSARIDRYDDTIKEHDVMVEQLAHTRAVVECLKERLSINGIYVI